MTLPTAFGPRAKVIALGLAMLAVGVTGIAYEYSFSKLASDILGDPLSQWAITIGLMMLFMGLGADQQKRLADRHLAWGLMWAQLALSFSGGLGPGLSLWFFGHEQDYFTLAHYSLVALVGFLVGLEIPLLTRLNQVYLPELKDNLSLILKMDYLGAFVGAILWLFLLPRVAGLLQTGLWMGLVNLSVAGLVLVLFRNQIPQVFWQAVALLSLGAVLVGLIPRAETIQTHLEQKLFKDRIVLNETSLYQKIILTQKTNGELRLYLNGHLQFCSSDEFIYHEMLTHPALGLLPQARRALVLGGGDGLALRELLKYPQLAEVDLIDLDPAITELATRNPILAQLNQGSLQRAQVIASQGVSPGPEETIALTGLGYFRSQKESYAKVRIMNLDALTFIQAATGFYDVMILDFPDPNSPTLAKLYSVEFYEQLKARLVPGGLILQQGGSPAFAKEAFLMVGRSMQAAGLATMPLHQVVPSFGDWGFWLAGHAEVYGSQGLASKLAGQWALPPGLRYVTPDLISASSRWGRSSLETQNQGVNRLLQGEIFYLYRDAWLELK